MSVPIVAVLRPEADRCPTWTVNGEVKGVGSASQQGAAKDAAAKAALEALGVAV